VKTLRELVLLLRVAQTHLCVSHNERDVERAKQRLAMALESRDQAIANLRVIEGQEIRGQVPEYLRKIAD